jgi:hypothetical protein
MGSRVEIVEIFLHQGARDDKEDKTGAFAFEYITNCDIKNLFLQYGMRVTDAESMAGKRKSTSETAAPTSKQICLTLIKDTSALMRTLLRAKHTRTAQQPLRREIEGFPLYDPGRTNSFMYLEAAGFLREVLLSEAMPIEAPVPNKYNKPDLQAQAPKIVYVITNQKEYQLHITLLNAAYTRKIVFCNRAWYRRDLYEIYLWSNITKTYQDYKEKLMNSLQGTATATTLKMPKKPTP